MTEQEFDKLFAEVENHAEAIFSKYGAIYKCDSFEVVKRKKLSQFL